MNTGRFDTGRKDNEKIQKRKYKLGRSVEIIISNIHVNTTDNTS